MRRKLFSIVLLCGLFFTCSELVFAQGQFGGTSSEPVIDSAVGHLRITCDPESDLEDVALISALLNSREVVAALIRSENDSPGKQLQKALANGEVEIDVSLVPGSIRSLIRIVVLSKDDRFAAHDLLVALVESLRIELEEMDASDAKHEDLRDLTEQSENLKAEIDNKKSMAVKLRASLSAYQLDDKSLEAVRRDLFAKKQELRLEVLALESRVGALAQKLSDITSEIEQAMANDPLVAKLEVVVEYRQAALDVALAQQVAEKENEKPIATSDELIAKRRLELAQAEADLVKAREESKVRAGGGLVVDLRRQLTVTEIELFEASGRSKEMDAIAAELHKNREPSQLRTLESEIAVLERWQTQLLERLTEKRITLEMREKPTVTLILNYKASVF